MDKKIGRPATRAADRPFSSEFIDKKTLALLGLAGAGLLGRALSLLRGLGLRRALLGSLLDRLLSGCHFRGSSDSGTRLRVASIPLGYPRRGSRLKILRARTRIRVDPRRIVCHRFKIAVRCVSSTREILPPSLGRMLRRTACCIRRITASIATLAHQLRGLKQLSARGVKASSGQNKSKIKNNFVRARRPATMREPDHTTIIIRCAKRKGTSRALGPRQVARLCPPPC